MPSKQCLVTKLHGTNVVAPKVMEPMTPNAMELMSWHQMPWNQCLDTKCHGTNVVAPKVMEPVSWNQNAMELMS